MLNSSLMAVRKVQYDKKLCPLLEQYSKILIFGADNVDSKQLQEIRSALHDHSVVMMGKNTMMRRSLQIYGERTGNKAFLSFIPLIVGKVGLIFTKGDLQEVGVELGKYKVGEPSRVGLVSQVGFVVPPIDIVSQPRSTGMDPSHTSIFELYHYLDLADKFSGGVSMIVSLLLAISYPTLAVAPHMFVNAYNNVATAYSFPQAQKVKEYLYLKELFGCLASGKYSFKSASHPNRPEPLKELKFCRPGLLKKTVVPEKTLKPQQADTTLRKKNNEK